jgi:hypothetical protein
MCSCVPGYFGVVFFSACRVIALYLVKICNFQLVARNSKSILPRVMKLYSNVACEVVHFGFHLWIFFCFIRVIALGSLSENL